MIAKTTEDTVSPTLAPPWGEARTLADLGRLTADWLEGRLEGEHPNGYDRPDEETLQMIPVLAAASRAGFVTLNSQPGGSWTQDGAEWEQWATVDGLVQDESLVQRLTWQAWIRGIQMFVYRPWASLSDGWKIPVTVCAGEPVTFGGHRIEDDEIRLMWEGCHEQAVMEAITAWQVTLIDPESGRRHLILSALQGALTATASADTMLPAAPASPTP